MTVPVGRLDGQPGALPARTATGAPVGAAGLGEWLCGSTLTRFVLSLGGRVIEASHTQRTITGLERRIKNLETAARCQTRGCTRGRHRTGAALIPHHAVPWATSGMTSLQDTVLLCGSCHRDLHLSGATLTLRNGRRLDHDGWRDHPTRTSLAHHSSGSSRISSNGIGFLGTAVSWRSVVNRVRRFSSAPVRDVGTRGMRNA